MLTPSTASRESSAELNRERESDIFDPAEAMNRACDDWDLLAELAELFVENRNKLLDELTEAVAARNGAGIAEAAHALKGSIGTFTTKRPFALVRALESCGKEGQFAAASELLGALKKSLGELETAVQSFLSSRL